MQEYPSRCRQSFNNYDETHSNGRRSYNFGNMQKSVQLSETDKRIQEIKRKYDTPNRKERISQLSVKKSDYSNKENDNYGTADFKTKTLYSNIHTEINETGLKESKVISHSRQNFYNNPSSGSKSYMAGIYRQRQSYDSKLPTNKLYTNQNEEQFFKRVKQMKQSLLYGDNPTRPEMKSSIFYPTKESRAQTANYDSNQTVEKDRIDNIDKINQKIKGILECLNQNQKTRIPSKYDQKRSKIQNTQTIEQDSNINPRQITRTPIKNAITSSFIGRQGFGNHRHERSQIVEKIELNKDLKPENTLKDHKKAQDDEKWQKLSSKLQKYELQNKLRLQKAYDFSKEVQKQVPAGKNIVENIRKDSAYAKQTDYKRQADIVRRDNRSIDMRDLRSKSILNSNMQTITKDTRERSLHTRTMTGGKEYEMKSGKKLDDQIDRIQKKIQQFEEEKKRLNINFKPFEYSNSKSTSNLAGNAFPKNQYSQQKVSEFTRISSKPELSFQGPMRQNLREQFDKTDNHDTFREKKQFHEPENFHDASFNRLDTKIQIKLQKSNPSSVRTSKFLSHESSINNDKEDGQESFRVDRQPKFAQQSSKFQLEQEKPYEKQYKYIIDESLKKHTDEGIQERRKKLMNSEEDQQQNKELKNLVKALCDQVQLDESFRNAKIWYEYNNDPRKEEEVKKLLPKKSVEEIRQILKVRQSENNPFFTTQGYDSSFQNLINLLNKAEDHWNSKLYKKFNKKSLSTQGFTEREIDLEKKGHINLGDLVRFLNLESGTFYRNRDLSLVFIRIGKEHKTSSFTEVSFQQMQSTFCS